MMITEYLNNGSLPPNANPANSKGLVYTKGKVFRVLGYFNFMDSEEFRLHHSGPVMAHSLVYFYEYYGASKHTKLGTSDHYGRVCMNIQVLKIKSPHLMFLCTPSNTIFVFTVDNSEHSIFDLPTSSPYQAIKDYLNVQGCIPLIASSNRLVALLGRTANHKYPDIDRATQFEMYPKRIDGRNIDRIFRSGAKSQRSKGQKTQVIEKETDEQRIENEPTITKLDGYDTTIADETLLDIHKRIIGQAQRIGGFVSFNYKGNTWKIPKAPLVAWCNGIDNFSERFEYEQSTWRVQSPEELKCHGDNTTHSDWWIGAGIPVDVYGLYSDYFMFNRAISSFAADISGQNTLENVKVLAGKKLSPIKGRICRYPTSLDDVNEGDVLILESGGVQFDAYIRKACNNGKGAVILEVGNVASHLSIVANELNYRVINIPNAHSLICPLTYELYVDTQACFVKHLST